jgi:hypothetical protein
MSGRLRFRTRRVPIALLNFAQDETDMIPATRGVMSFFAWRAIDFRHAVENGFQLLLSQCAALPKLVSVVKKARYRRTHSKAHDAA